MLIQELAAAVHKNAAEHGWWDEDRTGYEILALIHSEWSEALEEARAGRPMWWYECAMAGSGVCDWTQTACGYKGHERCLNLHRKPKPEGVAVELMDGVIRILDFIGFGVGAFGMVLDDPDGGPATMESLYMTEAAEDYEGISVMEIVACLHRLTSVAMPVEEDEEMHYTSLLAACRCAMAWVYHNGLDPMKVLLEKHEYNKGRPYKHGKKF